MAWNPDLYEQFAAERHWPGLDLIRALPDRPYRRIVDLGCGTGRLTAALAARFPAAEIIGLDRDAAMLQSAAHLGAEISWQQGDIATWRPTFPPDLIYSNAALQWVPDHAALLPRLLDSLAPGGVLAVQMPHHYDEPSHTTLAAICADGPWAELVADRAGPPPLPELPAYYAQLAPLADRLALWRTTYFHPLTGPDPAFTWLSGTALVPVRAALAESHPNWFAEVSARFRAALAAAYPPDCKGVTLFSMSRMFLVATRP